MSELFGYQNTDDLLPPIKSGKGNRNIANKSSISPKEQSKSDKAKPEGKVEKCKYRNYYDINDIITTAQTTNPNDEDNANYNRERIFEALERNAEIIYVMNDGADILYVIISHEGGQNFARERPIYAGEHKTFFNVYELRLRSPTLGLAYRVTEYPICCVKTTSTVTGTVTANAGINLNTSALALEAGGNLSLIKTNTDKLDVNLSTVLLEYTIILEYDGSNNPIYIGYAIPGSIASSATWRIKKMTYDIVNNPTNIQWADGNTNFDNIWDNRATYSYS